MNNFTFPPGLLTQGQPGQQIPLNMGQPALMNPAQPVPMIPALQQQGATGNARGSSRIPNQRINMAGEGLIRIGAAGMGAAQQGGLAQMAAMGGAYGDIMDYNRAREMEEYKLAEEQRLAEQRRQDLLRKMNSTNKSKDPETSKNDDTEIARLEGILDDLRNDPNLTGPVAGSLGNKLDRSGLGDPKRAAKRLILSELQVNATLAYTAQTKGAITDREMALFQTPVPKLTDDEQVWIDWLEPQLEVLKQLQQNGITDEAAKQQGITPKSITSTPSVDDLVEQYDPQK